MSEREQILDFPLGSGLAQGVDPKVLPYGKLARLENLEARRAGGLTKRKGWGTALAANKVGTGALSTVYRLDGRGEGLLAIADDTTDQPRLAAYSEGLDEWASVDSLSPCSVRREPISRPNQPAPQPSLAPFGVGDRRFDLVAYRESGGASGLVTLIRDARTGAMVQQPAALSSAYAGIGLAADARSVSINGNAWLFYNTASAFIGRRFLGTDLSETALGVAGFASDWHDASTFDSSTLVVAYSSADDIYLKTIGNSSAAVVDSGLVNVVDPVSRLAVCSDGSVVSVVFLLNTGALKVMRVSGDLSTVAWTTTVATPTTTGQIGCEMLDDGSVLVLFERDDGTGAGRLSAARYNSAGVLVAGSERSLWRGCLGSSPRKINGRIYALAALPHDGVAAITTGFGGASLSYTGATIEVTHTAGSGTGSEVAPNVEAGHLALFCWDDPADDEWPVLVAKAATLVGFWPLAQAKLWPVTADSLETQYATAAFVIGGATLGIDKLTFDFSTRQPALWHQQEAPPLRAYGGGLVSTFDGASVVESGFLQAPAWGEITVTSAGTPGLASAPSPGVAYLYLCRYVAFDEAGQKHVGPWSQPLLLTLIDAGSGHYSISLELITTGATRRGRAFQGPNRSPRIEVYRSTGDGASASGDVVYYKLGSFDEMTENDPTALVVTFTDDQVDAKLLAQGEGQFVSPGDVLNAHNPPASAASCSHLGRLWIASGEDGQELWASQTMIAAEAPQFPAELRTRLADAAGPITALFSSADNLVICTADRLYYLTGEGPADNGSGEFWRGPYLLSAFHGCTDARSVVSTPLGTFFLGKSVLLLLDRNMQPQPVGDAVRDTTDVYSEPLSAVHDEARSRVLWLFANADSETIGVCYDYLHQIWSTFDTAADSELASLALWRTSLVVAGPTVGLRMEGTTADADYAGYDEGAAAEAWVTGVLETPWICPSGPGAYQRIRAVLLVGEKISAGLIKIEVFTNFDDTTAVQTQDQIDLANVVSPSGSNVVRYLLPTQIQACEAIKIRITDLAPDVADPTTGAEPRAGLGLQRITLEYLPERGLPRLAATNRGGT